MAGGGETGGFDRFGGNPQGDDLSNLPNIVIDPTTGQPIDANTGLPVDPNDPAVIAALSQASFDLSELDVDTSAAIPPYAPLSEIMLQQARDLADTRTVAEADFNRARRGFPSLTAARTPGPGAPPVPRNVNRWAAMTQAQTTPRQTLEELAASMNLAMAYPDQTQQMVFYNQGLMARHPDQVLTTLSEDPRGGPPRITEGFEDVDLRLGDIDDQFGRRGAAGMGGLGGNIPKTPHATPIAGDLYDQQMALSLGLEDLTINEARALVQSLQGDDLMNFQLAMHDAGFYGDARPQLGIASAGDEFAIENLIAASINAESRMSVPELLQQGMVANTKNRQLFEGAVSDVKLQQLPTRAEIAKQVDDLWESVMGQGASRMPKELRDQKIEERRNALMGAAQDIYDLEAAADPGRIDPGGSDDLDRILDALEPVPDSLGLGDLAASSDKRAIDPSTWNRWSHRVWGTTMPQTDTNIAKARRVMVGHYYDQWEGDLPSIAAAWHRETSQQDQISDYTDRFLTGYHTQMQADVDDIEAARSGLQFYEVPGMADLEAAIRETDPAQAEAYEYSRSANQFFSMLGRTYNVPR